MCEKILKSSRKSEKLKTPAHPKSINKLLHSVPIFKLKTYLMLDKKGDRKL
jgi:hypothetical protein